MSAPKDKGQARRQLSSRVNEDTLKVDWEFGQIKEVDESYLCKVVIFRGETGTTEVPGWHPIIKGEGGIGILQELYGKISKEMCIIVQWRGDNPEPGKTYLQLIGRGPNCGAQALIEEEEPVENELPTGPYKIMSGGMS